MESALMQYVPTSRRPVLGALCGEVQHCLEIKSKTKKLAGKSQNVSLSSVIEAVMFTSANIYMGTREWDVRWKVERK